MIGRWNTSKPAPAVKKYIGQAARMTPDLSYPWCVVRTLVLSATHDPFCVMAEPVHKLVPGSKLKIIENGPIDIDRGLAQRIR